MTAPMRGLIVLLLAACSGKSAAPPPSAMAPGDARAAPVVLDPGVHDDVGRRPAVPAPTHPGRPIDITLRSTPPYAEAAVDGVPVGTTPAYWSGDANGREHEFTFVLPGHAVARYRFVPITSGVIHARLEPIVEEPDAGVALPELAPPPVVAPPPTPPPIDAVPAPAVDGAAPGFGPPF